MVFPLGLGSKELAQGMPAPPRTGTCPGPAQVSHGPRQRMESGLFKLTLGWGSQGCGSGPGIKCQGQVSLLGWEEAGQIGKED